MDNYYYNHKSNKNRIILYFLIGVIVLITISSILFIYINNNKKIYELKNEINDIKDDIIILINYTETMSDFIINNYDENKKNINKDLLIVIKETLNKQLRT